MKNRTCGKRFKKKEEEEEEKKRSPPKQEQQTPDIFNAMIACSFVSSWRVVYRFVESQDLWFAVKKFLSYFSWPVRA